MLPESLTSHCAEVTLPVKQYGVYFLLLADEVVYVGRSNDVPSRIKLHVSCGEIEFTRALWIPVAQSDLSAYEGAFIRALAPRHCIKAGPDVGRDAEILACFGMEPSAKAVAELGQRAATRRDERREVRRARLLTRKAG